MWNWIGRAGWVVTGAVVANVLSKSNTAKAIVNTLKEGSRQILDDIQKDIKKKMEDK